METLLVEGGEEVDLLLEQMDHVVFARGPLVECGGGGDDDGEAINAEGE
jgi:hypothetical protein